MLKSVACYSVVAAGDARLAPIIPAARGKSLRHLDKISRPGEISLWRQKSHQSRQSAAVNPFSAMKESIIARYDDKNHLIQQRAWFLYVLYIALILAQVFSAVAQIATSVLNLNGLRAHTYFDRAGDCRYCTDTSQTLYSRSIFGVDRQCFDRDDGRVLVCQSQRHLCDLDILFLCHHCLCSAFCNRKMVILTAAWFSG